MVSKSIRVYTKFLDLLTETDVYQSLQFKRSYHFVGDFEIHINRYMQGAEYFVKGNIIAIDKQSNKVGIIHTQEIALDEAGRETENFIVKGESLDSLMARRVTVPPASTSHDRKSASAETVMKHYVRNNFVNPTDSDRVLERLDIADDQDRGAKIAWESRYKNIATELNDISVTTNLGWGIFADFSSKKFIFDVFQAHDLMKGNAEGNSPVFFSPEFDTIKSQRFIDSDANYRNVAYVGGQGEGVDRKIIQLNEEDGWERLEEFVDARDISDKDEENDKELTEGEIEQLLAKRGTEKLADLDQLFSLEAEIVTPIRNRSTFQYEVDYNLGDKVEVHNKSWGIEMTAPIVSLTEIHEESGFTLEATFGEDRPTIISKIKKKFDQLEGVDIQEAPGKIAVKRMGEAKEHTDQEIHKTVDYVDEQDDKFDKEGKAYSDEKARESIEEAVIEAVRQDDLVRQDAIDAAQKAEDNAVSVSVGKEIYNAKVEEIMAEIAAIEVGGDVDLTDLIDRVGGLEGKYAEVKADIEKKVDGAFVDGKLKTKADAATTYTKVDIDGKFDNTVGKLEWTTDKDGIVTDLTDQETRLSQTETELLSTASKNELDGVKNDLSTAKTGIKQNAEAIALKADSTVVNTVSGKVEANAAELKVQSGKISAKLDSTEYTKDKNGIVKDIASNKADITATAKEIKTRVSRDEFDDMEIGGRNLIQDSEKERETVRHYVRLINNIEPEREYMLSFDVKTQDSAETVIEFYFRDMDTNASMGRMDGKVIPINGEWSRVSGTLTTNKNIEDVTDLAVCIRSEHYTSEVDEDHITILKNIKLEKGNKATDWTPAPEDVANKISHAETEIKQNADAIVLRATKDEVSKDRTKLNKAAADITTNADAIKLRATSTQLNAEKKRIGEAESSITVLDKAVKLKASQSSVDGISGRVTKAEASLKVLPGQINAKVSKDGLVSEINATPGNLLIDFAKIKATGAIEADHIKSLSGLNVNGQFIVSPKGGVTFAGELEGASGTFGKVTVNSDDISIKDPVSSSKSSLVPRRNIIRDHSFELIRQEPDSLNQESITHNWLGIKPNSFPMEDSPWERSGDPKVSIQFGPDSSDALAIFGEKAIVVRNANYVRQYVYDGVGAGSVYTVSGHFKRQWNATTGGIPRIEIWHVKGGTRASKIVNSTFDAVQSDYAVSRHATSFTVPSSYAVEDSLEVIISGGNDRWVQCDGVQMVSGNISSPYFSDDGVWEIAKGNYRPIRKPTTLWFGEMYPRTSQTIRPEKTLQECANGWVIEWSKYVVGSGTVNSHFNHSYIPKEQAVRHSGNGVSLVVGYSVTGSPLIKYLYVFNDHIKGHDANGNGDSKNLAARAVYEY